MESLHSTRWKKKKPSSSTTSLRSMLISISLLISLLFFLFLSCHHFSAPPPFTSTPHCLNLGEQKFLYYAPHSGFSNQLSEFKNAILISAILNRTLIVPPVLDHHAVVLGSCPKFRVSSPAEIRFSVWEHAIDLIRSGRYVSMADIIDISELVSSSEIRVIDFRIFLSKWCGVTINSLCSQELKTQTSVSNTLRQCGAMLSGYNGTIGNCLHAVDKDCRTTVWTYGNNGQDGVLDSFQPDEQLKKKKKISYARKRLDVYKALGPGSRAESASLLAFGSLFSAPYKGSESHLDIDKDPKDAKMKSLIKKVQYLSFVPEILSVGAEYTAKTINSPFICAQLRLLDGQFKNHHKGTFMGLKEKLDSLIEKGTLPIHIFVMTDLPERNWTGTYLQDIANDSNTYRLHLLREKDELVKKTVNKLAEAAHGMKLHFFPESLDRTHMPCHFPLSPDILLYIEESICSCATLGFVGTTGSTIAESIELMRKNGKCWGHQPNVF